jgi:hypothetical protein
MPIRVPRSLYRNLLGLLEVTGVSIQEQMRRAIEVHLASQRAELAALGIEFPHELHFAQMSEEDFKTWMASSGKRIKSTVAAQQADEAEKPRRKLRPTSATA